VSLPTFEPYDKEDRFFKGYWVKNAVFFENEINGECEIEFYSGSTEENEYPIKSFRGSVRGALLEG
jgi:hypothetical protein